MPIYDSTLLRIEMDSEAIRLRTYSRKHRSYGYHLLYRIDLEELLAGGEKSLLDKDNGSFLYCWKSDADMLHIKLSWINSTCRADDSFTGWHDNVKIPLEFIREMLSTGDCTRSFLYINRRAPAQFDFSTSQQVIASIIEDKRRKRAFCKAMRDGHAHHSGLFRMFPDFMKHSFYFEAFEDGQERAYNGGLILHTEKRDTPAGAQEAFLYSRHT